MAAIKLDKLPDRTPVKLAITITPDLHRTLQAYAAFYEAVHGLSEPLTELVPAMLTAFVESDRAFAKSNADHTKQN